MSKRLYYIEKCSRFYNLVTTIICTCSMHRHIWRYHYKSCLINYILISNDPAPKVLISLYQTQVTILRKFPGIFLGNPRKFPGTFPGNPRKFPGIFHRKIRWKCLQLFPGISRNPFRGTRSEEFLVTHSEEFLVTHSEEILVPLSKEFLESNSREFLVTNYSEKPEKICSEKVFRTNSWKFPWNYSQDFLKSSSGISWNIH